MKILESNLVFSPNILNVIRFKMYYIICMNFEVEYMPRIILDEE